ncbi:flagellar hook-associated protein 3 [Desulfotomaculum nigrificans CO-1-SRB]|uniref:Flagellar hook-associated protein 3 n=1 Tax=Desulfotomaculum nigrificans (strain DSM 14880 / VKM B-2319 / CO-1-SRB) TaxID=868595 RepID=F6B8A8_DESCC|nr:flagellar hook-associated protein FlgL [Desulfotomaculum nigrificans]AEF94672.1 flagellar hook-associated protein 3 [Desulfotomaculum nigrificans CO-1-SRB]
MLRVSNILMANNMANYIQKNLQRSAKSQEQISTGKTIIRPSDNPSEISHLMAVNATIAGNEQYARNIQDGLAYLNQSDTALDTVGKYLQDAKTLALQAANGTLTDADREHIKEQVDKIIDAVKDIANSSLGGKYLFAGTKNDLPPFRRVDLPDGTTEIHYDGNEQPVTREILFQAPYEVTSAGAGANGVFGNLSGTKVIGGPFAALINLKKNLEPGGDINQSLTELDNAHDAILTKRVGVGARTRHLEAVKEQLEDQEVRLKSVLVDIQGADIAKLTIEVAQNQLVHQASLMTASNLLNTSLLQYLK